MCVQQGENHNYTQLRKFDIFGYLIFEFHMFKIIHTPGVMSIISLLHNQ